MPTHRIDNMRRDHCCARVKFPAIQYRRVVQAKHDCFSVRTKRKTPRCFTVHLAINSFI